MKLMHEPLVGRSRALKQVQKPLIVPLQPPLLVLLRPGLLTGHAEAAQLFLAGDELLGDVAVQGLAMLQALRELMGRGCAGGV